LTEKSSIGFKNFLTNHDNIYIITFRADLLFLFSNYQKKLQSDSLTITNMDKLTKNVLEQIDLLKTQNLLGGWLHNLALQIENREELYLKYIKLHTTERRNEQHSKYVTDKRDKQAIINEIRESLMEFLSQRFIQDVDTINILKPFVELSEQSNIEQVHKILYYDLDLQVFYQEYQELLMSENIIKYRNMKLSDLLKLLCASNEYCNLKIAFARIMAAKPSSADVERLISASNKLKTPERARMLVSTENYYLYIHYNMPALVDWDVRKAVIHFMKMKERRNTNRPKGKSQNYVKGIFQEADPVTSESDTEVETKLNTVSGLIKKKF